MIDFFIRQLKSYLLRGSIHQHDAKDLLQHLLKCIPVEQHALIRVRNDNGSKFAAKTVQAFITSRGIHQEFYHEATPEEDSFIESFHAIVERELVRQHDWGSQLKLQALKASSVYLHDQDRLHGSLSNITPDRFVG